MDSGAISPAGRVPSPLPTTATDFVRKLHDMLEDRAIENIVCWGPQNDCFIVKDINKFSVSVLPPVFNHANFASFVRQLNKYGFHKLKQGENQFSVFYHQHFHRDRPHDFQYIKRKVTSTEPQATEAGTSSDFIFSDNAEVPAHHTSSSAYGTSSLSSPASMENIVGYVAEERDQLWERVRYLEKSNELLQSELDRMKNEMGQNNAIIEALRNRLPVGIELGNATSQAGPSFSTPIMMEGTRNVPSSGLNLTSESLHIPGLDTEQLATRPSDFHGISFPTSINTRRQDSTFASPLRSFAFGSQSRSGQPTPIRTLPVTTGLSTATDRGLPTDIFTPTHGWSNAPPQGGLSLQGSQEIPQGMEIRRQGQGKDDASSGSSHRPPNSSPDAQSMYPFIGSSGQGMEFNLGEHNLSKDDTTSQGELRGSDGALYWQTGDPGAGAVSGNMDPQPAPFPISVETVGRWSFDTSTVAPDGMLHGLGIAVGGPQSLTNPSESDAVLVDCDSDPSPAMLESD